MLIDTQEHRVRDSAKKRALFESYAQSHDSIAHNNKYSAPTVLFNAISSMARMHAVNFDEANLCDLGTGTGLLLEEARRYSPKLDLLGLDISQNMLAIAQSKKLQATLIPADLQQNIWPVDGQLFRIVTICSLLHYILDQDRCLDKACQLVGAGGVLGLTYQDPDHVPVSGMHEVSNYGRITDRL